MSNLGEARVRAARAALTHFFLKDGTVGVECGAGSRPFPVPDHVIVKYGDLRDQEGLSKYFAGLPTIGGDARYDAQTMDGFEKSSLDFILCGHVIEHLQNPIGAIINEISVLKKGGYLIHAVPDMRLTFDRNRPETEVDHLLADLEDGGAGTRYQAYWEHLKFVHPVMTGIELTDEDIDWQATASAQRYDELDVHFHAWSMDGFSRVIEATRKFIDFDLVIALPIENENIFVMQRT